MDNQYDAVKSKSISHICWSAVFAGAFIGLGLSFLLQIYGMAISLSAYNSSSAGVTTIAIGGFLGFLVGTIAAFVAAGFVSGYLGRFHYNHCHGGIIYGFLTWSMALVLSAIMWLPFSHYTSSYVKALSPNVEITNALSQPVEIKPNTNTISKNEPTEAHSKVKITPTTLIGSSWLLFILFFIGALSCCIGACWGMACKKKCTAMPNSNRSTSA
ncbi:hypothetical protein Lnau_1159 [Legionella nautarum]|uniref:Transmembrane protein n=1 Tax=Legionella nautarum TaxID=45070 RepID=A0A0W0WV51_9GAMM|nr:hypothetical protein [Legionella nautarum]KTD36175.1 hypothetical protein Lnau_1159 [Legionella nautarum]